MDKSGADLLARYGNKIEEMDAAAAKRNEGEFDDLGDMDDDEEDEFAYKERLPGKNTWCPLTIKN